MLRAASILALIALLYCFGLDRYGLVGPDEPRYAAIGQAMAQSGDWITPRLWNEPWFEKPALLYWLVAAGYAAGLGGETAARLPVAILSVGFLAFFYEILRREFGADTAFLATGILASSAGWLAFSNAAVTDLPLSVTLFASLAVLAPWRVVAAGRALAAGALLGMAILAKGLVPIVLYLPAVWIARRRAPWIFLGAIATAGPWYLACYAANGDAFYQEFIVKHHIQRFFEASLEHVQPFWFFLPVLAGALLPWSPAVFAARVEWKDPRIRFFSLYLLFGLLFFSASRNKLPGYILPLLPALAVIAARALERARRPERWLAASAALLAIQPAIQEILPEALLSGLSRTHPDPAHLASGLFYLIPAAGILRWKGRLQPAFLGTLTTALVAMFLLKAGIGPSLDRTTTVRPFWRSVQADRSRLCLDQVRRPWVYGLHYYAGRALPSCEGRGDLLPVTDEKIREFQSNAGDRTGR